MMGKNYLKNITTKMVDRLNRKIFHRQDEFFFGCYSRPATKSVCDMESSMIAILKNSRIFGA